MNVIINSCTQLTLGCLRRQQLNSTLQQISHVDSIDKLSLLYYHQLDFKRIRNHPNFLADGIKLGQNYMVYHSLHNSAELL